MTNEVALLIISVLWLVTGRGVNLCLVILLYYALFLILRSLTLDGPAAVYYACQFGLDAVIILLCCKLSVKDTRKSVIPLAYAIVVFSSFVCDGLKFIDEAAQVYGLTELHEYRQEFSLIFDLLFAMVGSDAGHNLLLNSRVALSNHLARYKTDNHGGEK